MATASEAPNVDLPANFEQRCATMDARLQAGEPMTVEHLTDQLGAPYDFLTFALTVMFRAITQSVPALADLSPARPLH
ncbi:hypothetical protein [Bradyrhizobium sp. BR 1432]|uniref:hypothetical protein n=1 Tax=Bradyrhizobium sp. BR 1432 TaxID=3447966 RepID=UPI003EE79B61